MKDKSETIALVIIGAGPGGYAAAFHAADLGLQVTLIDPKKNPGGVCLYHGCIPTKTLLHFADVKRQSQEAAQIGLNFQSVGVNVEKLRSYKDQVVKKLTDGLGQLTRHRNIDYRQGRAQFVDDHTIEFTGADGEKSMLKFDKAIIATGAQATTLPGIETNGSMILDAETALKLNDVPETMLIVGAGYIGMEMGKIYKALGTRVTIVEMTPSILPGADKDLTKIVASMHQELLKDSRFETKVVKAEKAGDKLRVTLEDKNGNQEEQVFDKILVAIGMKPDSRRTGLEKAGVKTDDKGFVVVNEFRQTNKAHIYAIGDVAGQPMLAHKASHEGRIAAQHIAGQKSAYEPKVVPAVVYIGLAWAGLTQAEAEQQQAEVTITRFPWSASGRAVALGLTHGVTKLIFDKKSQRLLGAGFAGEMAEQLIAEATLAIEMGAVAKDLELTIHPHPTLSETIMEAAEMFDGQATHAIKRTSKKK
jgi:dihydrolipoamide dehydrogenase